MTNDKTIRPPLCNHLVDHALDCWVGHLNTAILKACNPQSGGQCTTTTKKKQRLKIIKQLINGILRNVPLSVVLDLLDAIRETGVETTFAMVHITMAGLSGVVSAIMGIIDA